MANLLSPWIKSSPSSSPTQILTDQLFSNQSEVLGNIFYTKLRQEMLDNDNMQPDLWESEYTVHKTIPQ